jgi:hypothetical protein
LPLFDVKELLKRDKIEYDAMITQRRRLSSNKSLNKTRFKCNVAQEINFDFNTMISYPNETSKKSLKSRSNSSCTELSSSSSSSSSKLSHILDFSVMKNPLLDTIKNVDEIDLTLDDEDDDKGKFKENKIKRNSNSNSHICTKLKKFKLNF